MQIIAEVRSPEYYELRAIEEVHAARAIRYPYDNERMSAPDIHGYEQHIIKAIQLLVLAGLTNGTAQSD